MRWIKNEKETIKENMYLMKMVDSERRFVITNENEANIATPNFNAKFLAPNSYTCDFYGDLTRMHSLKKRK